MNNIVAGQFEDFAHAEAAMRELRLDRAIGRARVAHIVLGALGRHARYPVGGDQDKDEGAAHGDVGALAGAVIGGAAGAVAAAPLGPVAQVATAAAGAYAGSLAGALTRMEDTSRRGAPPPRPAGVMVMVLAQTPAQREFTIAAFRHNSARSIEEAQGEWRNGTWADFDPVSPPRWILPPTQPTASTTTEQAGA